MLLDLIAASMRDRPGWSVGSKLVSSSKCFFFFFFFFLKKKEYTYDNVRGKEVQKRRFRQR